MKTFFNILALVLVFSTFYGQTIGINSTGALADNSAMLDIFASDKGLLIPRVTLTGTTDITTITNGNVLSLLVFNTVTVSDVIPGYYFWDGAKWVKLMDTNTNADHDWYEVGGTIAPNDINDNIFTQGNVGIGTDTPSRKLHISGSGIGVQKFKIEETSVGGESMTLGNGTAANTLAFSNTGDFWFGGVANVDNNMLATDADIFIEGATGNVGIGTSTPSSRLHIASNTTMPSFPIGITAPGHVLRVQQGGGGSSVFIDGNALVSDGANTFSIGTLANADLYLGTNDAIRMTVRGNGNIGMGITASAYQLQLGTDDAAKPTSASWTIASDRRLKENIKPFEGGLDDLIKISPVWFTYNGKAGMPLDTGVGVIAQDLKKIAPYMVGEWTYEDKENGIKENYLDVNNGAMTYMLINAVKELKAENDLLKERLDKLEKN